MEQELFEEYRTLGFKCLFCKGYNNTLNFEKTDTDRRSVAKQPITKNFQKESYKSMSYLESLTWIKNKGWLGWVVPKGYLVLDVDKDIHSIKQMDKYIKDNELIACIHETKNGKHYFFKTDDKIKANTIVLIKLGLDKITYRVGGTNYLILEPTEIERKWQNLDKLGSCSSLPNKMLPIDTRSRDELLDALAMQLNYYHGIAFINGISLDMALIGYLVKDLGLDELKIHSMLEQIFGDTYDEKRTAGMLVRVNDRAVVQKGGTFIETLKVYQLDTIIRILTLLGNVDISHNRIIEIVNNFNKSFFIIDFAGKVRFCQYSKNTKTDVSYLKIYNKESFELLHATKKPVFMTNKNTGKLVAKSQIEIWKRHPDRRYYNGIIYGPGEENPYDGYFNVWTSFAYLPKPGKCDLYLTHIKEVICDGNEDRYNYILSWLADAIQNLMLRPGVALALQGNQGTGKGVFVKHFGRLFGQHYLQINGDETLTTNFNSELRDKSILFADEVIFAGDHRTANKLKGLISEDTLRLEFKGLEPFFIPNHLRLIIASNNDWITNIENSDRRYFILNVNDSKVKKYNYFNDIEIEMNSGGYEALLYFLLNYKITKDLRDFPVTEAITNQKLLSMTVLDEFYSALLSVEDMHEFCNLIEYTKDILGVSADILWPEYIRILDLYSLYTTWCKYNNKRYKDKDSVFGRKTMKIFSFEKFRPSFKLNKVNRQYNTYKLRSLDECRAIFSKYLGYNPFAGGFTEIDNVIDCDKHNNF